MKRPAAAIDATFIVLGLPALVIGWQVAEKAEGRFIAVMTTVAAVAALVAVNHTIPRAPKLVVNYSNPRAGNKPVVWRGDLSRGDSVYLHVVLHNRGAGAARAVEVEFDTLGVDLWSESGGFAGAYIVETTANPARFVGKERVLNPGERWTLARLHALSNEWNGGIVRWRARADGMEEQAGQVEITLLDRPPG